MSDEEALALTLGVVLACLGKIFGKERVRIALKAIVDSMGESPPGQAGTVPPNDPEGHEG
jgi:hypothetical protein